MDTATVVLYAKQVLVLVLVLSAPVVLALAAVGLFVGLAQAVTSIQDSTLPYAIKIVVGMVVLVMASPWIGAELLAYGTRIFELIGTGASHSGG